MYLYFNDAGNITTCIPHGQTPRQGNGIDVWLCFNDTLRNRMLSPVVQFCIPNGDGSGSTAATQGYHSSSEDEWGVSKTFTKTDAAEATYDLKEGTRYAMYHWIVPSTAEIVQKYGPVTMLIRVVNSPESSEQVNFLAPATITLAKTSGAAVPFDLTADEYRSLLGMIAKGTTRYDLTLQPTNGCTFSDHLRLRAWNGFGILEGVVKIGSGAQAKYGFYPIAVSQDSFPMKEVGNTLIGTVVSATDADRVGSDVQFRILPSALNDESTKDADESRKMTVCVSELDVKTGDVVSICGLVFIDMADYQGTGTDDTEGIEPVVISGVSSESQVLQSISEPSVKVSVSDDSVSKKLNFSFSFPPQGEVGQKIYYTHTITLTAYINDSGARYKKVVFTVPSQSALEITSVQDLTLVFGGRDFACTGGEYEANSGSSNGSGSSHDFGIDPMIFNKIHIGTNADDTLLYYGGYESNYITYTKFIEYSDASYTKITDSVKPI